MPRRVRPAEIQLEQCQGVQFDDRRLSEPVIGQFAVNTRSNNNIKE